jgi:hypothetical protein
MCFFQERSSDMGDLQVVKEHVDVVGFVAHINIEISALAARHFTENIDLQGLVLSSY